MGLFVIRFFIVLQAVLFLFCMAFLLEIGTFFRLGYGFGGLIIFVGKYFFNKISFVCNILL